MRWLLVLIAVAGFCGAVMTGSPALLGLCLAVGFVGAIAAVFAFAQARIEGSARAESLHAVDMAALQAGLAAKSSATKDHEAEPP